MLFRIDHNSSVPLFEQVAASVRRELAEGGVPISTKLPPAREVADSLDINLHTVLRAYQSLRDEGLIELRRGRGAVVTATEPQRRLGHLIAQLRTEARKLGLTSEQVQEMVKEEW